MICSLKRVTSSENLLEILMYKLICDWNSHKIKCFINSYVNGCPGWTFLKALIVYEPDQDHAWLDPSMSWSWSGEDIDVWTQLNPRGAADSTSSYANNQITPSGWWNPGQTLKTYFNLITYLFYMWLNQSQNQFINCSWRRRFVTVPGVAVGIVYILLARVRAQYSNDPNAEPGLVENLPNTSVKEGVINVGTMQHSTIQQFFFLPIGICDLSVFGDWSLDDGSSSNVSRG